MSGIVSGGLRPAKDSCVFELRYLVLMLRLTEELSQHFRDGIEGRVLEECASAGLDPRM